ncbi:MAG TPA: prepilin-type N-terminal cleavage/methylation domain-containing protein [Actinomycetota bacterium]|nr:prepilin-type N-terminal cleavage/methylation domain-containing protein [Actinomycetota bacterium]
MRCARTREGGFTLIETLSALLIFSLVTLGTTPLLLSSIRGASLSGSYTVGKNLASEAMERVRGFPFFESVKNLTSPPRRDVLDLYFPDRVAGTGGTGFSGTSFVTTCTSTAKLPASSANQACPPTVPPGFTLRYVAQFVEPGPAPAAGADQTFVPKPPATNYSWSTTATETPPTRLLMISITASWPAGGKTREFSLSSLVGVRHLTDELFRAYGKVGAVTLIRTSFLDSQNRMSNLTVNGGESESSLASRALAEADQEVRGARATLVRQEYLDASGNLVPAATLQDIPTAAAILHAPPNPVVAPVNGGNFTMSHNELTPSLPIAFVGSATTMETGAATEVVNELPWAAGNLRYTSTGNQPTLWVNNQASVGNSTELLLSPLSNEGMVTIQRSGSTRMRADTSARAYSLTTSGGGYIESKANASFAEMRLFPTTFITATERSVVVIKNFTSSVTCKAVATSGTPVATGTWSAELRYWEDPPGLEGPRYTVRNISGSTTAGAAALTFDYNPLVYDNPLGDAYDLYLFRDDALGRKGYFLEMTSTPLMASTNTGGATSVSVDHALELITAPTKPGVNETALNVTIGNLSCGAVDNR